jgi:hypothetical protein
MKYAEARQHIKDGDVILFRGSLRKIGNCMIAAADDGDGRVVCSGLTWQECAAAAGWEHRTRVTPRDVFEKLNRNLFFQYRGGAA